MAAKPNQYLGQKWRQSFRFFDVNDDGKITKDDFDQFADNICKLSSASEEEAIRLTEDFIKWMKLLKPDTIAYLDITTYLREVASLYQDREKHVEWNRITASSLFDIIDLDKNGKICKQELAIFYQAAGRFESDFIDAVFEFLDKDGDGLIQREEYVSAFVRYFTSPDIPITEVPMFGLLQSSSAN